MKLSQAASDVLQLNEGIWMDQNSPLIFPTGWAQRVGYMLEANRDYFDYLKKSPDALVCFGKFK